MKKFDKEAIKDLRRKLGLTQEEFAHQVGVTFSTVNRWEIGRAIPSKLARRALSNVVESCISFALDKQ
ncbi:MAG: helix-turn-helix domain-containing protein [bacterium]|nr:helix-turn-helix domain-containing protein [bacterium]